MTGGGLDISFLNGISSYKLQKQSGCSMHFRKNNQGNFLGQLEPGCKCLIQKEGRNDPISKSIFETAELPRILNFLDPNLRIHMGFLIAIIAVFIVYWLIFHTNIVY